MNQDCEKNYNEDGILYMIEIKKGNIILRYELPAMNKSFSLLRSIDTQSNFVQFLLINSLDIEYYECIYKYENNDTNLFSIRRNLAFSNYFVKELLSKNSNNSSSSENKIDRSPNVRLIYGISAGFVIFINLSVFITLFIVKRTKNQNFKQLYFNLKKSFNKKSRKDKSNKQSVSNYGISKFKTYTTTFKSTNKDDLSSSTTLTFSDSSKTTSERSPTISENTKSKQGSVTIN
uniref:Uncharacterized protein n=1 Tax=Strongyloides papillosus TaxID=174720 RepID=A0A0N5C3B0_STREA